MFVSSSVFSVFLQKAQFSANSAGPSAPVICGTNTGYHMILEVAPCHNADHQSQHQNQNQNQHQNQLEHHQFLWIRHGMTATHYLSHGPRLRPEPGTFKSCRWAFSSYSEFVYFQLSDLMHGCMAANCWLPSVVHRCF